MQKARTLVDHPLVNINWVLDGEKTALMWLVELGDHTDPILRMLLSSDRIAINTKGEGGRTALLYASSMDTVLLREFLSDDRFDARARDDWGDSILDYAVFTGAPENVRIIIQDGRVQPTASTFIRDVGGSPNQPVAAFKVALRHVGRQVRDDFQNARRVCSKMQVPKEVMDAKILPFLGQIIFEVCSEADKTVFESGSKIDVPDHVDRLLMFYMKKFVELFGNVNDFDWPDVSEELEKQADEFGRLPNNFRYFD